MTVYAYYESPLGKITMEAEEGALTGLWFTRGSEREMTESDSKIFDETKRWLMDYFAGKRPDFMPELRLQGTAFRNIVWNILRTIPYGETVTYGAVAAEAARRMGKIRMSAQAAGGAVGRRPFLRHRAGVMLSVAKHLQVVAGDSSALRASE